MNLIQTLALSTIASGFLYAADGPGAPPINKTFDQQISMVERETVSLAEAMPDDKYSFVPSGPEFKKSRTFGQQASHIAAVNFSVAAALLGEKAHDTGSDENGPSSLKTKADIVKYLKDSFAAAHRATAGVTTQTLNEMIKSAFGNNQVPRVSMLTVPVWHTFDHYGQMAIYARLCGVVPPASR